MQALARLIARGEVTVGDAVPEEEEDATTDEDPGA